MSIHLKMKFNQYVFNVIVIIIIILYLGFENFSYFKNYNKFFYSKLTISYNLYSPGIIFFLYELSISRNPRVISQKEPMPDSTM
jgi:hypothetical protein